MFPRPNPVFRRGVRYVGSSWRDGDGTLMFPAGAAVGDLALIATSSPSISGWTRIQDGALNIHWKRLSAGDISSGVAISSSTSPVVCAVYAGAVAAALKAVNLTVDPLTIPGFTKTSGCLGVVAAGIASLGGGMSASAPFTVRDARSNAASGIGLADVLPGSSYTNGTDITLGLGGNLSRDALALELF